LLLRFGCLCFRAPFARTTEGMPVLPLGRDDERCTAAVPRFDADGTT
jgi:hypothetical protein